MLQEILVEIIKRTERAIKKTGPLWPVTPFTERTGAERE